MRGKFNPDEFYIQLEKLTLRLSQECEFLTTSVVDNPTFLKEPKLSFRLSGKNFKFMTILGLLSWSFPDQNFGSWIRASLWEENNTLENKVDNLYFIIQKSYKTFLCETSNLSVSGLFGIMNSPEFKKWLKNLRVIRTASRKVKVPQRKRGYHDKGSRRPSHKWKESHCAVLAEKQFRKELNNQLMEDTLSLISGILL